MNHGSAPRSQALTWIVSVLAVLLLYVATWPLIEVKVCGGRYDMVPFVEGYVFIPNRHPGWLTALHQPIRFLADTRWAHDPLWSYYNWWTKKLVPEPK